MTKLKMIFIQASPFLLIVSVVLFAENSYIFTSLYYAAVNVGMYFMVRACSLITIKLSFFNKSNGYADHVMKLRNLIIVVKHVL